MEALVRAIHSEDLVLAFIHLGVLHQIEREGPHAADGMPVRTITLGTTLDALEANPEQFLDQLAEQMKEHENCKTVTLDVTQLLGAVFGGRS
jgi:hypothetical protein